jgi:hypothetical protein
MSIKSAIVRSKDDNTYFRNKSYSNLKVGYEILDAEKFVKSARTDLTKRIFNMEYSIDHVTELIRIFNKGDELITVNQIRDLFDDVGFNTDVTFSETFGSDIMMVYNIGGYLIPGWKSLVKLLYGNGRRFKSLFLTKLAPGVKRLHCRLSENHDGSWYMTSHIDEANWMNFFNARQMVKSHLQKGTGNYADGILVMEEVMRQLCERFEMKRRLFIDVEKIYRNIINNREI